jgi:hypothetical protein
MTDAVAHRTRNKECGTGLSEATAPHPCLHVYVVQTLGGESGGLSGTTCANSIASGTFPLIPK